MAEVIDTLRSARNRYDWDKWTNGKTWRVRHGRDFHCSVAGFVAGLYVRASRDDSKVIVANHGESVEFQFVPKPKPRSRRTAIKRRK